jgi:hypothetical protein
VRLYYRTTRRRAAAILADGFHDQSGHYGLHDAGNGEPYVLTGVWLSDVPLDENEGACGDTVLTVVVEQHAIRPYEIIEDGIGYRS